MEEGRQTKDEKMERGGERTVKGREKVGQKGESWQLCFIRCMVAFNLQSLSSYTALKNHGYARLTCQVVRMLVVAT